MWRKNVQDTISSCEVHETPFDLYLMGLMEPHYMLPARLVTFDYWPAKHTENGKAAIFGQDNYRPGGWFLFMLVEEQATETYSDELIHLLSI